MFFMNLLVLYTLSNWLPTLMHTDGLSIRTASIATTVYQLAGTVGGLAIARLCDLRPGAPVLTATFLAAAASLWLLGMSGGELIVTLLAVTACGFFVIGGQNAANAFVGGFYPPGLRATGLGWAHGIGRFGSIAGPLVAGGLFAAGATPAIVFKLCAVPAAVAALSVLTVGRLRAGHDAGADRAAGSARRQPVP
jgi:AAHS family 4-hydroxybenzoate transporter-like MFS transporter